ncbi:alpha/beta hydrolase [Alteromonadaceae bacterium M269]|nr:alpha/beta hydrolase [Alteromonadaceae bacterium M269]
MKKPVLLSVLSILVLGLYVYLSDARVVGLSILNSSLKIANSYEVVKDVAYGPDEWQKLDVYPQPGDESAPVVVFIHGGAWYWGSKELYYFAAEAFLRLGYTVVVPDYVKYPEGRFPSFVEDGARALAWTKANISQYSGDPNRLFLSGHSAGAHTGALLMTDKHYLNNVGLNPSDVQGFAGIAGPYNFTPEWPQYIETFGKENFEAMKASSHVDGSESPQLLLHAKGDSAVGIFNQETFQKDLENKGSPVDTILYDETVGHNLILLKLHPWFADQTDVAKDIDLFFKKLM